MSSFYTEKDLLKFEQLARKKTTEVYSVSTDLRFDDSLVIEDNEIFTHFRIKSSYETRDDVLYLFPHTGFDLPRGKFSDWLNLENKREVVDSMILNRDAGTTYVLNSLLRYIRDLPFSYSIIYPKLNRNVIDFNRLKLDEQIPDVPFSGISLWKKGVDKQEIVNTFVNPFLEYLEAYIKSYKPRFILQPHTYDEYSGKSNGSNKHDIHNGKRPTNMIFNRYKFDKEAVGDYGDKNLSMDFELLTPLQIEVIQNIQLRYTNLIPFLNEEAKVTVDFPYVSPVQLCGLIKLWTDSPHLILENRKDLLKNGYFYIYNAIVKISEGVLDTL